jgi:AAA+ superfamily predicted ATPase
MAEATLNGQALYFYDLEWLGQVFGKQLEAYFGGSPVKTIEHPKVNRAHFSDEYAIFVRDEDLLPEERLLLILALAPHIRPAYLDDLLSKHVKQSGDFPQIGGGRGKHFRGFIPTGETFLFIIAGAHDKQRIETKQWLHPEARLFSKRILHLEAVSSGEPSASGKITVDTEFLEWFLFGKKSIPKISPDFPAQHLQTKLTWDDLVLNPMTQEQIREIEMWVKHHKTLLNDWEMSRRLSPGYKALFHGPPGTGKTFTATLLGKYTNREVFRVDLSLVISKYIGETEKNLATLFDKAEHKDWILFFDEADALFSKRTNVRDAHDKYANQEVSYLLQRLELFPGLVILASNFKNNIDDAFARRFQSVIYFPMPKSRERLELWKKAFPARVALSDKLSLDQLAEKYELTGANIMNIVQYACLKTLERGEKTIQPVDVEMGISKEFAKEGKMI